MRTGFIAGGIALAAISIVFLFVLLVPWIGVVANASQCAAFTWGGPGWERERAWTCEGKR